ncbi:acyl-CoA dehydrogenase family protein [Nonomuraea sp. MCN248]|uniref:Acyl-CoA dehydrogenase family protein n=1 Tax=Nonomuraea corallina TaxID=2989783 RepID=A0ABT4S8M5_9ACTN|nr:acyl-CoA dehydrogenase family protein [Nonomuraea corallina]MDA0633582.1 acyl-CoA dehydrogenase family protein [Nonomuraea corallina]
MTVTSEEDLEEFRESVRGALSQVSASARVRAAMLTGTGWDEPTWRALVQLDLPGLMLPERCGGSGLGAAEFAVAAEECGAWLACSPLFGTATLAVPLLLALGDEAALGAYGPRIARGELTATVALAEAGARWDVAAVRATARRDGDGWRLHGVKTHVVDGATADLLLVVANTPDGPGVFAVERDAAPGGPSGGAAGMVVEPLVTLDLTRKMARIAFDGTPAVLVGPAGCADALASAADVSRALLAAEQTGVAQRCLDLTVAYAKTRIQFARPIGSFQVVKERLADALIKVESARSAVYTATRADGEALARDSRVAALMAGRAASWVTAQTIQLHGGVGFTWEHDAHLYFKRARTSAHLLGEAGEHVAALAGVLEREIV